MTNERSLLNDLARYYRLSKLVKDEFGGPSVYFHVQAIKEQHDNFLSNRHLEMIYATLASWGMHRMGASKKTKTKMVDFSDFKGSIIQHASFLKGSIDLRMDSCTLQQYEEYIEQLKKVYCTLKVSISKATIVAHSKTLSHILPNLIPPVDRQYTVRFFTQNDRNFFTKKGKYRQISLPANLESQFRFFEKYCNKMKHLFDQCDNSMFSIDNNTFNTSFPKIMDNLIMSFVKEVPKPE